MLKFSRVLVSALALGFGVLLGIFGLLRAQHFANPALIRFVVVAYFALLTIGLFSARKLRLPVATAILLFGFSVILPIVIHTQHLGPMLGDYDTWYITGVGILLSIVAVRGYQLLAAFGAVALGLEVTVLGGPDFLTKSGLTGALLLIASCIGIAVGLQTASRDIEGYQKETIDQQSEQAAKTAAREQHDAQLAKLMADSVPTLELIATGKRLSKVQRQSALELEQRLRDEVTGGRLLTPKSRVIIAEARDRGATVAFIDSGLAASVSVEEFEELLDIALSAIESAGHGDRVRLTSLADGDHILRLTISRPGVVTPSLDLKLGEGLV